MKRKQILSAVLCMATLAGAFTACAPGAPSAPVSTPSATSAQTQSTAAPVPVELTYLTWDATKDEAGNNLMQNAIDAYTKENPNVTIKLDLQSENDSQAFLEKLDMMQLTGKTADIIGQPSARTYNLRAEQGFFRPMDEFLAAEGVKYTDLYSSNLMVNDKYYALPLSGDQIYGVFINKTMLDEAKLPMPEMGWTWDDYATYAKAMTKGEGANKVYGSYLHLGWAEFLREGLFNVVMDNPYINEDGSSNLESKYFGEWLEYVDKLQKDGSQVPLSDIKANNLAYRDVFFSGKAAMLPIGEWLFTAIVDKEAFPHDFEIAFAPFPVFSDGKAGVTQKGGSSCLAIGANTSDEKAKAAYDFIRWFSNEGAKIVGNIPADRTADIKAAQTERCAALGLAEAGFDVESFLKVSLDPRVVPNEISRNAEKFDEIDKIYVAEAELYLLGSQPLETTLKNFVEQGGAVLAR